MLKTTRAFYEAVFGNSSAVLGSIVPKAPAEKAETILPEEFLIAQRNIFVKERILPMLTVSQRWRGDARFRRG